MPFMKKADLLAEAERRGIDLTGLSWPEQQKKVQEAMAASDSFFDAPKPKPATPQQRQKFENPQNDFIMEHAKQMKRSATKAKPVLLSAEIKPMPTQLFKYHEDVGDEVSGIQDVSYLQGMPDLAGGNASATYIVKGKTGRRQLALSTVPHQNAQIVYDPNGRHWLAPIVKDFDGKEGYLFNHHKFGGIKPLLMKAGYWEKYKNRFNAVNFPQNIWMAGGKFYACDMGLCEAIFKEIEKEAKDERR